MITYEYTLDHLCCLCCIHSGVANSTMGDKSLSYCNWDNSIGLLSAVFENELSDADKAKLDVIVEHECEEGVCDCSSHNIDKGQVHTTILPLSFFSQVGSWILDISSAKYLCGNLYNVSGEDLDSISYVIKLEEGNYSLLFQSDKATDRGIVDIDIDDVEVASFDCYGESSPNYSYIQSNILISSTGIKELKIRVDGKNILSSGYICPITFISLWRVS